MGYGEGSFDSGGGGYDGGGWDGGSSDWGGGDSDWSGGGHSGGGNADCDDCSKENRPKVYFIVVLNLLLDAIFALFLVSLFSSSERDICGSITDLNRGEQRICQTTKTEDVLFLTGAANVTAYRYSTKNLPPTETRIIQSSHSASADRYGYLYFDFALSAGGTITFSYEIGYKYWPCVADLYLMTPAQFHAFRTRHKTLSLWAHTGARRVNASYTAKEAGVYFLVADNDSSSSVHVEQSATITSSVFQVSNTTATQVCNSNCTLQGVRSDETVVVEYIGPELYVDAVMYHGNKKMPIGYLIGIIVLSVLVSCLLGAFVAVVVTLVKQRKTAKSSHVVDNVPDETTTGDTEGSTPQEMTPENDITQPLVTNTANDPVYYGTAPPPEYV